MKYVNLAAALLVCGSALAQEVHFDYDRSANFGAYKTYQWVDYRPVASGDELLDLDIKRAVDEQLAGKGLRRVETGGDLQVTYQGAISQETEFDSIGFGPGWWGDRRVTSSTIETGTLVVENDHDLQKAIAKLFQTYPSGAGKH